MLKKHCFVSIDIEEDLGARSYRGVEQLDIVLNIFKRFEVVATLFVTGEVLERYPDLVKDWSKEHEIACHSYFEHVLSSRLPALQKEENLSKFIDLYDRILGAKPYGFRAVQHLIFNEDFNLLEKTGFSYDSSVVPRYIPIRRYVGFRGKAPLVPYRPARGDYRKYGNRRITEIPLAPLMFGIPLNGTYLRYLTPSIYKILLKIRSPKFLSLSLHSWDSLLGGKRCIEYLEVLLLRLRRFDYKFMTGEKICQVYNKE